MNKSKTLALLLSMTMLFSACGSAKTDNKAGDSKEAAVGETTGEGTAAGHNGDLKAVVTFDGDKIAKIDLTHEETEGLGDKAADKLVEEIVANNSVSVDTVTGATVTSTAVIEAVKAAIEASGRDVKNFETESEEKKGETVEKDTDVVVIGGGGAGFAAAVSAKEAGADVILVEKLASVGGNTLISGGEYAAPANYIQKEEGIEDSKELFAKDVEEAGGNPELIKVLADKATEDAYWLRDDIGVKWLDSLMFFGGHSVKRSLIPAAHTGNELIKNYLKKAEELGIEVLTETDVKEILSKDGKVCGIKAETKDGELVVNAKSVVVASGGFGANADMCYEFDKEIDEHVLSTNSPGATGDGILMAEKLGADTVDMDKIQLYPVCDVETGKLLYCGDTRLVGGALLVNKEGKRFVEELGTRREISMAIKAQTDYVGYVLWDETSNEKTGTMKSNPEEAKSLFDRGLMVKADTLEELADHFGIDKDALLETVKTFNENSAKNEDPEFNLRMLGWQVKDAPFYMMKAAPAVHHTMGGLKINTDAQVLNKDGEWIDGLYAAGEVTGGIHGSNRLGSVAMADITVFGRIAGENAAANAKK
ncbi:flavocytochrome c [Anaerococcus murdochii]|uniref:Urocanate reductase n=1 Tax=Anaerococcus murdochii TaxID=411577 RepID=A0ABS7SZ99_9FIRM|nr:flavocytochrome c [Anaerococcus murdochii]MBZ2386869.1 flavocytochrome c [Anaerococcus murdochii]